MGPAFGKLVSDIPILSRLHVNGQDEGLHHAAYANHLIIVGYGLAGKNVARSAKEANIPYLILEMNPDTVRAEKARGEPIHFGDATHHSVLHHLHVESAKCVVIAINDHTAAHRITELVKK